MSVELYYRAATSFRLPCSNIVPGKEFTVSLGAQRHLFYKNMTPLNFISQAMIIENIWAMTNMLMYSDIPFTPTELISFMSNEIDRQWIHENVRFPISIKSNFPMIFKNSTVDRVQDPEKLLSLIKAFQKKKQDCILQPMPLKTAQHYSALIVDQRILGIVQHVTSHSDNSLSATSQPCSQFEVIPTSLICEKNHQLLLKTVKILKLHLAEVRLTCQHIELPYTDSYGYISFVSYGPDISKYYTQVDEKNNGIAKKIVSFLIRKHIPSYVKYCCAKAMRRYA